MDAREFFYSIAKPNYDEAKRAPDDLRLLWNAVVSLNTVAEFVALHRLNYEAGLDRNKLLANARQIRQDIPELDRLNECAIALKHVRRIRRRKPKPFEGATSSSTGFLPSDPSTWSVNIDGLEFYVADVLEKAFPEAMTLINNLRPPAQD